MRLSTVFELLLVFLLLAFAAWGRVIEQRELRLPKRDIRKKPIPKQETSNRYCSCTKNKCNCCREFTIPVIAINGPGCASLQYLNDDRIAVSMSLGNRVLSNTTISGRKPKPICMPLPGSISKFCGRLYSVGRQGEDFSACLSLELQSLDNIEAALRVSCFKFGQKGLELEPARPLPSPDVNVSDEDDDDDDDDDDDLDLDEDDLDDDDDFDIDEDDDDDDTEADAGDNDVDSADYTGFSVFGEDILGALFDSSSSSSKPSKKKIVSTTTKPAVKPAAVKRPTRKPGHTIQKRPPIIRVTSKPLRQTTRKPIPTKPARRPSKPPRKPTKVSTTTLKPTFTSKTPIPHVIVTTEKPKIEIVTSTSIVPQEQLIYKPTLIADVLTRPAVQPGVDNHFEIVMKPVVIPKATTTTTERPRPHIQSEEPISVAPQETFSAVPNQSEPSTERVATTSHVSTQSQLQNEITPTENVKLAVDTSISSVDESNEIVPTTPRLPNEPDIKSNLLTAIPETTPQKFVTFIPNLTTNVTKDEETIPTTVALPIINTHPSEAIQILTSQLLTDPHKYTSMPMETLEPELIENVSSDDENKIQDHNNPTYPPETDQNTAETPVMTMLENSTENVDAMLENTVKDLDKRVQELMNSDVTTEQSDETTESDDSDEDEEMDDPEFMDMIDRDEENEEEDDGDQSKENDKNDTMEEVEDDEEDEEHDEGPEKEEELVEESRIFRYKWPWE